jgi:hypothetical protein
MYAASTTELYKLYASPRRRQPPYLIVYPLTRAEHVQQRLLEHLFPAGIPSSTIERFHDYSIGNNCGQCKGQTLPALGLLLM